MTESKVRIDDSFVKGWFSPKSKKSQMFDDRAKKAILGVLEVFKNDGTEANQKLPRGRIKCLLKGIWEIRVGQYRIAYFWDKKVCVLLEVIEKKTNKWGHEKIELIKTRQKNYLKNKRLNIIISNTKTSFYK